MFFKRKLQREIHTPSVHFSYACTEGKGGDNNHKDKEKKKKKNPGDKNDPSKLKLKLEKLNIKMRDLETKRGEILKAIEEAETNAVANPNKEDDLNLKQD